MVWPVPGTCGRGSRRRRIIIGRRARRPARPTRVTGRGATTLTVIMARTVTDPWVRRYGVVFKA